MGSWDVAVPQRIGLLPSPAVATHLGKIALSAPAQDVFGFLRTPLKFGHISWPPFQNRVGKWKSWGLVKAAHNVEHAESAAWTDVQGELGGSWCRKEGTQGDA